MKKRILCLLLALCMVAALLPVTEAHAAATPKYYTVEKYDADGNGTMLVPPTEASWTGSDYSGAETFFKALLGSDNVKVSYDAVTGIQIEDGVWLNNDGSSQWYVATNYSREVWLDFGYFYFSDADVYRFIYVPGGDFSKAGMTDNGGWPDAYINVEKGDLVKTLAAYDGAALGGNRKTAFDAGIAAILDINATDADVAAAKTAMETASDAATAVELKVDDATVDTIDLYEGQKQTLTAELTPGGSTDTLTWTSSDPAVVSVTDGVIKGMSAGTATVTVTAENPSVTDSVTVTVTALDSVSVRLMVGSSTIEAETQSLTLWATATPSGIANLDWVWSVEDDTIAEVTPTTLPYMAVVKGKTEGTTKVYATLGTKTAAFEVVVTPYTGPYVYFEYKDGRTQLLDENDTITLTCLDEGRFVVGNGSGTTTWSGGSANVTSIQGGDDLQYWVFVGSETGEWRPWDVRDLSITANCGGWAKSFTVKCVSSGITELKTYVGDQEVTVDAPYESDGKVSGVPVTVMGKNADGEWVFIPQQALHYATSDTTYNFRWIGNQFSMNTGGQATLSVFMRDNWSVKQQFIARCNYVPLTGFTIETPETFTITGEKDFMTGYYYGLQLYTDNLKITYTPGNATYTELEWEALTPDIAFFTTQHNSGIVPLRCGTARFRVTSKDNPALSQEVVVTFLYQKPLVSATLDKTTYELSVGDTENLNITVSPADATEKGFTYSYSEDGIVEIKDGKIVARSAGQVTVTATPLDTTQGCPSITFTVNVTGSLVEQDDPTSLVTNGIAHGLAYLENQAVSSYGDEWSIFTILRAGGHISAADQAAYLESVAAAVQAGLAQPTDYARVILTLGVMGEDPTNFAGVNLVEQLYSFEGINRMSSNMICWTLIALDSKDYEIPENAVNTRAKLIEWLLDFQTADGGFCLSGSSTSVDMTGMILQSLAPYNNENDPAVQAAFAKAVTWLKAQMGVSAGFADSSAYNENSCTTAQVLTALSAAGIDAVNPDNGFTIGKNNMVTNLYGYQAASGFYWDKTVETSGSLMGTQQTTYALEAYRRFAAGENALYDLTDVATKDNTDYKAVLEKLVAQAETLNESVYTEDSWSAMAQKLQIARVVLMSGTTDQAQLKEAAENLQNAIDALVTKADLETANAFIAKVDALPSADEITEDYKDTVTALLEEYEGLSKAVKNCIPEEYITKLNDCNDKIAALHPIKVTISVLGDSKHDSDEDGQVHTLAGGGLTPWIAPTEYSVKSNATVKDVLEMVLTAHNMTWSNPSGNYVASINGLGEFDNGTNSGWMYTLNGIHPNVGVAYQSLKDGDVIVFHYTDDYTKESDETDPSEPTDPTVTKDTDPEKIYRETGSLLSGYEDSKYVFGTEWVVLGLSRSDLNVPDGYYKSVVEYVKANINSSEQLHRTKSTDNSRLILALTALGYDVTDVGGHNLLVGLNSMRYIQKQGINGPIWALIAFDSHDYEIPAGDVTREKLIETILAAQLPDGGWAFSGSKSDSDMTGMALQALAPYYKTNADIKAAVDKALDKLSEMQLADGGFYTYNTDGSTYASSESTAQVIVALTALGINPETDARFIKNGYSAMDALCAYAVDGGGFRHLVDGEWNGMATEQGYYALAAYFRFLSGKTSLYDMSDVTIRENIPAEPETPDTGDESNVILFTVTMAASMLGLALVLAADWKKRAGK
ncbi:MAG: Ig-like domain-containing protein [Faecousia sp.]